MTLYQAIKESINAQVRAFVMMQGGEVLPTAKNTHLNLFLFGDNTDHEILALRYQEDNGIVCVESSADGDMHYDDLKDFSNEEMWQIIGLFLPREWFGTELATMISMKENIQKLMEEFNEQYPNGDSFELAEFMYRKGFDDGKNN